MRSHIALIFTVLLVLFVGSASPLYAQERSLPEATVHESSYFTLSGGWSWPVGGPVQDSYQSGFGLAASFRKGLATDYLGGIEFGYSWYSLDSGKLAGKNPGSTFSGGNMGLLSITTENDYLFGPPKNTLRPFVNLGIGYYKSFIDDATKTTGSTAESYSTGVYEGSFFGFHAGIGALINRDRFGLRLDANYQHLFAGGPDLEFFTARGGIIFYLD
jgi:outer membrane protein W